ncbi:MAG: class I SAM-dependent methyltransferase [Desulfobacterales bacterium]|nr:class I SAM-dependent methyltransferase [Desulfobacterales bacterium]
MDDGLIEAVKGFLDKEEGRRLYETALIASRMGPCLEIGSYCGKSALYLGAACRKTGGILFSIDHHRGSEEQQAGEGYFDPDTYDPKTAGIDTLPIFRQTLFKAGLEDVVVPVIASSEAVAKFWSTPLGLVFIDGGHTYEAAAGDYTAWAGHIMAGGYLLIHDIFKNPEEGGQAPYYVYRLALASGLFRELPMTRTLGVLQRRKPGEPSVPADT